MIPAELIDRDIAATAKDLRDQGAAFAIATVIRTAGATAGRPGDKAVLLADGTIAQGWIGGGCVRAALKRATARAFADRQPQLISLHPEEILAEKGIAAGPSGDGVNYARNGCPSKGSMDIFVEPILPQPELIVFGDAPVAHELAALASGLDWSVRTSAADTTLPPMADGARRMIVVATQGKGDIACLEAALNAQAEFIAFVGSRRKFGTLSQKLRANGADPVRLDQVQAPAGLAIDAVTPKEIALSILAQLIQVRRHSQRDGTQDV